MFNDLWAFGLEAVMPGRYRSLDRPEDKVEHTGAPRFGGASPCPPGGGSVAAASRARHWFRLVREGEGVWEVVICSTKQQC